MQSRKKIVFLFGVILKVGVFVLSIKNEDDKKKMIKYYRTRDMLNLLYFFPNLSPIKDLVIVESVEDYLNNKD